MSPFLCINNGVVLFLYLTFSRCFLSHDMVSQRDGLTLTCSYQLNTIVNVNHLIGRLRFY
jgi:hypothetical protein